MKKINLAIFASGAGSNAGKIIEYNKDNELMDVVLIVSNKPDAGVLSIARKNNIDTLIIERKKFYNEESYFSELKNKSVDYIILAGFLWKIPQKLIDAYPEKIINIHPALLPKYGGKGMYGSYVHQSVIANREKESGITIHLVDEHYDNGKHLFQAVCAISEKDTPESLSEKIHLLEHAHFPRVIEEYIIAREYE